MEHSYDVIVIGGGNGGLASAASFAVAGKSVILFENTISQADAGLLLEGVGLNSK